MEIRTLPDFLINQIAAGEVIERPAFIIKELVENAIDAMATEISIIVKDGGKKEIIVFDNGIGMTSDQLKLSIQRHATSKLPRNNLNDISFLGFRGEALPSIASISELKIESCRKELDQGWCLQLKNNQIIKLSPSSIKFGTKITVNNLFENVPARLKFLKSNQVENKNSLQIIKKIALGHPEIKFLYKFEENLTHVYKKENFNNEGFKQRILEVFQDDFFSNSLLVENKIQSDLGDIKLRGFISIPSYNKVNQSYQFLFVNGRPVQDRGLSAVIRLSYRDTLPRGRHPLYCLMLDLSNDQIDVNVHPTKLEVKFQNYEFLKSFVINSITKALQIKNNNKISKTFNISEISDNIPSHKSELEEQTFLDTLNANPKIKTLYDQEKDEFLKKTTEYPLGSALYQFKKNFIISITSDDILLIDQHAAHERILFEKMKKNISTQNVTKQILLIPININMDQTKIKTLFEYNDLLKKIGLEIEKFGENSILIREVPSLLINYDIKQIIVDLCDDLMEIGMPKSLDEKINLILGNICCHKSIRSGRILNLDEMNALLREMEVTPNSGQCNHGRPTSIALSVKQIEKLFERI